MLQAQIKAINRRSGVKIKEAESQSRESKAEVSNVDIVTLREQLLAAKMECEMWRKRAEAAERQITTLEQCAARNGEVEAKEKEGDSGSPALAGAQMRNLDGAERDGSLSNTHRTTAVHHDQHSVIGTDDGTAAENVWKTFQAMHQDSSAIEEV